MKSVPSQGSPQGPWETLEILGIFRDVLGILGILNQILKFLIKITCFFSFSSKNDGESSINFIKIPFLDPKRAKLVQSRLLS